MGTTNNNNPGNQENQDTQQYMLVLKQSIANILNPLTNKLRPENKHKKDDPQEDVSLQEQQRIMLTLKYLPQELIAHMQNTMGNLEIASLQDFTRKEVMSCLPEEIREQFDLDNETSETQEEDKQEKKKKEEEARQEAVALAGKILTNAGNKKNTDSNPPPFTALFNKTKQQAKRSKLNAGKASPPKKTGTGARKPSPLSDPKNPFK